MKAKERVALVTGAAKRVGRAVAVELARMGYDVALHYHQSDQEVRETAAVIDAEGQSALVVRGDLKDSDTPEAVFDVVMHRFGRLDVLVNNAATFDEMSLEDFDVDRCHECLQINLTAPIRLCQLAAPVMRQNGWGNIINFTDISTTRPRKNYLAYGVSKSGLDYMTRALSRMLAPEIRVNAIAPGVAAFPPRYDAGLRQRILDRVPLERAGTPEEMAKVVRFLVESEYITGQIINVDGGRNVVP